MKVPTRSLLRHPAGHCPGAAVLGGPAPSFSLTILQRGKPGMSRVVRYAPRAVAILTTWLSAAVFTPPVLSQSTIPGPGFEDVIGIRYIGGFALSPGGDRIAFEVRTTN